MFEWIYDSSNPEALDPAWVSVCRFTKGSRSLRRDGAWLHGFMMDDQGTLIQHGIGTIVSSQLATLLYRDIGGGLAENAGLSDPQ